MLGGRGGGRGVVLDEHVDNNYEPTEHELEEYAQWLGMDLEKDRDLFWIARQGLKGTLPKAWKRCQSGADNEIFYFNSETGESVWDHPSDDHARKIYQEHKARREARTCNIDGTKQDTTSASAASSATNFKLLDDIVIGYQSKVSELITLTQELSTYSSSGCGSAWSPSTPMASPRADCAPLTPTAPHLPMYISDSKSLTPSGSGCIADQSHRVLRKAASGNTTWTSFSSVKFDGEQFENDLKRSSMTPVNESDFKIKEEWEDNAALLAIDLAKQNVKNKNSSASYVTRRSSDGSTTDSPDEHRGCIQPPSDQKRVVWDLCGFILIFYDLFEIPLGMSFDPPRSLLQRIFEWVIRLYWTSNVPVALSTGYLADGVLIMNAQSIACHYCKTWMIVDVCTLIPDWLYFFLDAFSEADLDDDDSASLIGALRFLRLWRLARLIRMAKLRDAWYMIHDVLDSEKMSIVLKICKNITLLIVGNHFIACMWFAVGSAQDGRSWLKFHRFTDAESDWEQQFLASFHWSLTQLTPSSVNIYAQSDSERVFSIGAIIFGFVGFSYLVGSITSSLGRLQTLTERRATNFWLLRKYLNQNKVPHGLSVRIRAYVESQWERQEAQTSSRSIDCLDLLSENLKSELRCAIDGPSLCIHPLFSDVLSHLHGTAMRHMLQAISHLHLAPGDVMFTPGVNASSMSFVTHGTMQYERVNRQVATGPEVVHANQDWIAEPVLWVKKWCHVGDLIAETATEMLQLHPEKLSVVARTNPLLFSMFSIYAKEYLVWLSQFSKEYLSDITSSHHARDELAAVVHTISTQLNFNKLCRSRNVEFS